MALIIANNRLKMEFPLGLRALYFEMAQGTLRFKDNSHAYNAIVGRIEGAMMAQCAALGVARSDIIRILHKYVSATNKLHTISTGAVWKEFGLDSWQSLADLVTYELKSEINYLQEIDLAVYSADGALLAAVGPPLPAPPSQHMVPGWMRARGAGPTVALALPDGRFVVARWQRPHRPLRLLGALGLLAIAMALGTYSIVRRITRRLERLQTQVEALGAGDLTVRVEVEGRDEVAQLARSFNHAADRIARLVNAQRTMLAGASHELRSPLARMRMDIELLPHDERPELQVRLTQDIVELGALIDELLLASRLDTLEHLEHTEEIDRLALLAEEGARSAAEVSGSPICIQGEPRMLRRLMRNLFENA